MPQNVHSDHPYETTKLVLENSTGHTEIEQNDTTTSVPRSTRLQVRAVPSRNHVQVEITVYEVKSNRLYSHFGALVLTPEEAAVIAKAFTMPTTEGK